MGTVHALGLDTDLWTTLSDGITRLPDVGLRDVDNAAALIARVEANSELDPVEAVVLGPSVDEPVRVSQRVHALDLELPVLILLDPDRLQVVSRAIRFAPYIGQEVRCHSVDDPQGLASALYRAVEGHRQRQRFRSVLAATQARPRPAPSQRRVVRYLDRLVEIAPVGVVVVDGVGLVESWNPAAQRILGKGEVDALGTQLSDLFDVPERAELVALQQRVLASESGTESSLLLRRPRPEGEQFIEVIASSLGQPGAGPGALFVFADATSRMHAERARQWQFGAAVGQALTSAATLTERLEQCAAAIVDHLEVAYARIWTVDRATQAPHLEVSVGETSTAAQPPAMWVNVPEIVREQQVYVTNTLQQDDRLVAVDWARNQQLVAFVGLPLIVDQQPVGAITMYSRYAISDAAVANLKSVAESVALAIAQARTLQELEAALAERQAALDSRNLFLRTLAHDLKAPMSSLGWQVQVMMRRVQRGQFDAQQLDTALQGVNATASAAIGAIDELHDLTRLAAGVTFPLDLEMIELGRLVQELVDETPLPATHRFRLEGADSGVTVPADRARLARALANLLNNAVKYSPSGGEVVVHIGTDEAREQVWATVRVTDSGIGIPAEDLPHVFDLFHRGQNAQQIPGEGLGLASVQELVKLHGGWIDVTSTSGAGSIFTVWLPLTSAVSP